LKEACKEPYEEIMALLLEDGGKIISSVPSPFIFFSLCQQQQQQQSERLESILGEFPTDW
jgi:hypothetical protein